MQQKLQWDSSIEPTAVLILYRIHNGLVAIPASTYLQPATVHTSMSKTRYRQVQCNTNVYSHTLDLVVEHSTRQLQRSTKLSSADINAYWSSFY